MTNRERAEELFERILHAMGFRGDSTRLIPSRGLEDLQREKASEHIDAVNEMLIKDMQERIKDPSYVNKDNRYDRHIAEEMWLSIERTMGYVDAHYAIENILDYIEDHIDEIEESMNEHHEDFDQWIRKTTYRRNGKNADEIPGTVANMIFRNGPYDGFPGYRCTHNVENTVVPAMVMNDLAEWDKDTRKQMLCDIRNLRNVYYQERGAKEQLAQFTLDGRRYEEDFDGITNTLVDDRLLPAFRRMMENITGAEDTCSVLADLPHLMSEEEIKNEAIKRNQKEAEDERKAAEARLYEMLEKGELQGMLAEHSQNPYALDMIREHAERALSDMTDMLEANQNNEQENEMNNINYELP